MDMIYETNYVKLCGTLSSAPVYSHSGRGRQFFTFPLEVSRLSGNTDTYLGNNKNASIDKKLAAATKWVALAWVILTLLLCL